MKSSWRAKPGANQLHMFRVKMVTMIIEEYVQNPIPGLLHVWCSIQGVCRVIGYAENRRAHVQNPILEKCTRYTLLCWHVGFHAVRHAYVIFQESRAHMRVPISRELQFIDSLVPSRRY